ncbi:MAG TPA: alkaline phosphatase family protein, partial [Streptosporangiaceae bacterium]|nr:alkaline phosphatase family protein [Streptosporangiaceae bacterium]
MTGYQLYRPLCRPAAIVSAALAVLTGCTSATSPPSSSASSSASSVAAAEQVSGGPSGSYIVPAGIHKIRHVIIVMQENRSFDSYFGTYPGADGIAMSNGTPTACVPNPAGGCTRPYHDTADVNGGGPHGEANAVADVDDGKMDGFIAQRDTAEKSCANPDDPA